MKNVFSSHFLNAAAVTALLLAAGCVGSGKQSNGEVEKEQNKQETSAIATKVTAEPVTSQKPVNMSEPANVSEPAAPSEQTGTIVLLDEHKDLLRIILRPEGSNADEKALAADIVQRTQGALGSSDAKIINSGKCDVRAVVRPKLTIIDQDGGYFRMNTTVSIEMTSADGQRIFGTNKVEVAAPRRVLGKDAAIAGLAESASPQISDWCRKELSKIADTEIGVSLLTIQMPPAAEGQTRNAMKDAANIKAIGDEIAKMPNLVSYELSGQDLQDGTCKYRVVYFSSKYPNGIANEVSVRLGKVKQK